MKEIVLQNTSKGIKATVYVNGDFDQECYLNTPTFKAMETAEEVLRRIEVLNPEAQVSFI